MIEMQKYDGFQINMAGDFYEILITADCSEKSTDDILDNIRSYLPGFDFALTDNKDQRALFELEVCRKTLFGCVGSTKKEDFIIDIVYIEPILPTHSWGRMRSTLP